MWAAVRFCHDAEHSVSEPHDELKQYIGSPLEDVENVVVWWGVSNCLLHNLSLLTQSKLHHHSIQYPTLLRIARDYLAIQGSATPLERAFLSGGTAKHNCLTPEAFEELQLLRNAYHNGHLAADIDFSKTDDDEPAGPKWKGKGHVSDHMDMLN